MKVLVTGASGLLGWRAAIELSERHDVVGGILSHPVDVPGVKVERCDLTDPAAARRLIATTRPGVVVHAAAQANVDACERDPEGAFRSNVVATRNLVEACIDEGVRQVVYVSTDFAFDGSRGAYREDDAVATVNAYARTKLLGEDEARRHPGHLILRTSIFGWNVMAKHSLAERVIAADTEGGTIGLYSDSFSNALDTGSYARFIAAAIDRRLAGLYHLGSRPPTSKLFFGLAVARAFRLHRVKIEPRSLSEWNAGRKEGFARRPHDTSLNTARVRALEPMPSIFECIARMKDEVGLFGRVFGREPAALSGSF